MGMKIVVVSFEENKDKNLSADYKSLSNEVVVTEFLSNFFKSEDTNDLYVYEEDEKISYRELKSSSIESVSEQVDKECKSLFDKIKQTSGREKTKELLDNLEDMVCLNTLLKKFFQVSLANNNKIKIIFI